MVIYELQKMACNEDGDGIEEDDPENQNLLEDTTFFDSGQGRLFDRN
jgi:hypothetical protein